MANPTLATFKIPQIDNEPFKDYSAGSKERKDLEAALSQLKKGIPFEVPCIVNGKEV